MKKVHTGIVAENGQTVKMALDRSAKEEGVTTSAYVRSLLIDALVSMS